MSVHLHLDCTQRIFLVSAPETVLKTWVRVCPLPAVSLSSFRYTHFPLADGCSGLSSFTSSFAEAPLLQLVAFPLPKPEVGKCLQ